MRSRSTNYIILLIAGTLFAVAVALTIVAGAGLRIALIWNLLASLYVYYSLIPSSIVDSPLILTASVLDAFVFGLFAVFLATWFTEIIRRINITEHFVLAKVRRLRGHIIVAPYNSFSKALAQDLSARKAKFVVIAQSATEAAHLYRQGIMAVVGEVKSEESFKTAGVERAAYVIACDDEDVKNALISITAKDINPEVGVISRVTDEDNVQKIANAGASSVVLPGITAGISLGDEIIKRIT